MQTPLYNWLIDKWRIDLGGGGRKGENMSTYWLTAKHSEKVCVWITWSIWVALAIR